MTHFVIFVYDRSVAVASRNIVLNQVKFCIVLALLFFFFLIYSLEIVWHLIRNIRHLIASQICLIAYEVIILRAHKANRTLRQSL